MITEILFTISFTCMVFGLLSLLKPDISVPAPLVHVFKWTYANAYLYSFGVGYQAWFWAKHAGVL